MSLTATVSPAGATGTVQFAIDGNPFGGPVAVSGGGTATSGTTSSLSPGDHTFSATYSGDVPHSGSTGNGALSVGKVATTTDVDVSPASPKVGDDVTFQ